MIAAGDACGRMGRSGTVLPRRSDRDLGPRADPEWMLAGPNSLLPKTHPGPRGADAPRGPVSERLGVQRIRSPPPPPWPISRAQISRRRVEIAWPGDGVRPASGPPEVGNPRNRAKRRCRWLAYHACRARSLVRLVRVASIVVPPPAAWDRRRVGPNRSPSGCPRDPLPVRTPRPKPGRSGTDRSQARALGTSTAGCLDARVTSDVRLARSPYAVVCRILGVWHGGAGPARHLGLRMGRAIGRGLAPGRKARKGGHEGEGIERNAIGAVPRIGVLSSPRPGRGR
jgi:hypothetical protein